MTQTQIVSAPASNDRTDITPLGYCASRDDVINKDYAFAAYKETDLKSGKWKLKIKGSVTTSTSLDPEHPSLRTNISKAAVAGAEYALVGAGLKSKEDDARLVEQRLYFDGDLFPSRMEIHVVTRNADGTAKEKQTAAFDWPAQKEPHVPVLKAPESNDRKTVTELAYVHSYDVINDKDYAYLACKEADAKSGKWIIRITAKSTAGGSIDPGHPSFRKNIDKAADSGADHAIIGFALHPKDDDPRQVETRILFDDKRNPTRVELHVVTRKADGSANEKQVAGFDWPSS